MTKEEVIQQGISVIDSTSVIHTQKDEKLELLKKLIPEVVNADGQLNTQALHDFIDTANTTSNNKGYELTFAGKGIARAMADTETNQELKVERKQSKDFENTENVVIRGDNLDVLKILKQNYFGKIKMIYIDPPYNTKSENFIYNDNFKQSEEDLVKNLGLDENTTDFLHNVYGTRSHSGWLSFIYPRLKLARDLLKEDGVIFISIDDNEQANLKIMCDEIFGEENFVGQFTRKTKGGGKTSENILLNHDYVFLYTKKKENLKLIQTEYTDDKYKHKDKHFEKRGLYKLSQCLDYDTLQYNKSMDYEIIINDETYYAGGNKKIWQLRQQGQHNNIDWVWRWGRNKFHFGLENDFVVIKNERIYTKTYQNAKINKITKGQYEISYEKRTKALGSIEFIDNKYSNDNAKKELDRLFDFKVFEYPKNTNLLKHLLTISTNSDDIILDFFAGSGTTGDAVMQLNAEDRGGGGRRKFILVQWDEAIKENTEAYNFCKENNFEPVISSITIERLNRAGEKIKAEQKAKKNISDDEKIDIGYKVFSLTEKQKIRETKDNNQALFTLENKRTSTENTLYNMLCATGKPLHTKITELVKDALYYADNELYVIGDIENKHLEQEQYKDKPINIDGYSNISLELWLNLDVINKENIKVIY